MNKHECPAMVEITVDDILIKNEEYLFPMIIMRSCLSKEMMEKK